MTTATEQLVSKTAPWRHQRAALDFSYPKRGVLLAMQMGTGKSKVVVDLIVNRGHAVTLILCPLSVVGVWPRQFQLHAGREVQVVALDQETVAKRQLAADRVLKEWQAHPYPPAHLVFVTNYEAAWREPLAKFFLNAPLECLVLDESHRVKSPEGRASKFCAALGQGTPYRIALTGTPMPHSPLDIWAQMRAVEPALFGLNYHRFRQHFALLEPVYGDDMPEEPPDDPAWRPPPPKYVKVVGHQNQEELAEKLSRVTFQVGAEVLDLPEALHEKIPVKLSDKGRALAAKLEKELQAEIDAGVVTAQNALVKLLRLQQISSGFVGIDGGGEADIDCAKRAALADLLEDLGPEEPCVVACNFHHDLDAVAQACKATGRPSFELSGRRKELEAWRAGPPGSTLAVQIRSGGLGVDLTMARYAVLYSLGFDLAAYLQFLARVHRPGQFRPVVYYHLVARGSVDGKVYRALKEKRQVAEAVLEMIQSGVAEDPF